STSYSMRLLATLALSAFAASPATASSSSAACKKTHQEGFNNGTSSHTIHSGDFDRTYAVKVPDGYNQNLGKKWPLILDFHGNSGTPWQQYQNSRYFDYPGGQQYLVVYPAGYDGSWQGASYSNKNVNDLQFVTDLTARLKTEYCIDESRMYASGKSNGGGFVDLLACSDNGDEFSAFAMAAAALYSDTKLSDCSKKRAILESHGDKDQTISYHPNEDGSGGPLPDVGEWVSWWGQRTCGSNAEADYSKDLGGYNTTTYSCNGRSEAVKHYRIFELGHCWP
ncbi:carbohydrate esterase family 1 protein, partial [Cercospora zeae-maydis SCOH1-5]